MSAQPVPILYLHNISQISGGERSLLNLFENLDHKRFKPILFVPQEGEFSQEAAKIGIKVYFGEVPKLSVFNLSSIFSCLSQIKKIIEDEKVRLIHSYAPRNNLIGAIAAKEKHIKTIWHERNLVMPGERDVTKAFLFLTDAVICNSYAVAKRFEQNGQIPKKVQVVLNGVNLEYFKPSLDAQVLKKNFGLEQVMTVGMVTNLNKRKRVEFFIEVAANILQKYKNVKFFLIGGEFPDCGGQRLSELKALTAQLGIEQQIVFTGYQGDVRSYLNALDIFMHVTVKEACSRAILEAMASGKPVIAVNDGGNPELIEENKMGILLEAFDKEGFANAAIQLLKDELKRKAFGVNARQRVQDKFDVRRNAQETEDIYLNLLKQ